MNVILLYKNTMGHVVIDTVLQYILNSIRVTLEVSLLV